MILSALHEIVFGPTTTHIQFIKLKYETEDGGYDTMDGWVTGVYRPRGLCAFEWYSTDDVVSPSDNRTEIAVDRVIELNRGEWREIKDGDGVPY